MCIQMSFDIAYQYELLHAQNLELIKENKKLTKRIEDDNQIKNNNLRLNYVIQTLRADNDSLRSELQLRNENHRRSERAFEERIQTLEGRIHELTPVPLPTPDASPPKVQVSGFELEDGRRDTRKYIGNYKHSTGKYHFKDGDSMTMTEMNELGLTIKPIVN